MGVTPFVMGEKRRVEVSLNNSPGAKKSKIASNPENEFSVAIIHESACGQHLGDNGGVTMELEKDADSQSAEVGDHLKATKNDAAVVRTGLWLGFLIRGMPHVKPNHGLERHLDALRSWMLCRWKRGLTRSFFCWLKHRGPWPAKSPAASPTSVVWYNKELERYNWTGAGSARYCAWWYARVKLAGSIDFCAGREVIHRAANSTWWKWEVGSSCIYWRWPTFYQHIIRDGMPVLFVKEPPEYMKAQMDEKDSDVKQHVAKKLEHARERGYIGPGTVKSLTSFFAVPKGIDDIRMVYDASKSGLNDAIWVPRFPLPTIATHLRAVESGTFMADLDVGEMFLNFNLHPQLQQVCGVDLTHYCLDTKHASKLHEVWTRAAMGLRSSPYQAVQAMTIAEELILGDRLDESNPFRWAKIRLNLPGQDNYDSSLPWVSKVQALDPKTDKEVIACDVFIYVDDVRITGPTETECWAAAQRVSYILTHLGIQDAARKRREPRRDPGAWAGAVLRTDGDCPAVEVSMEKWTKTKMLIDELQEMQQNQEDRLPLKRLLQIRGFLLYVTRTYRYMIPHLKGLHLTIDGWRAGRDAEGWKNPNWELDIHESLGRGSRLEAPELLGRGAWASDKNAPKHVKSVARLKEDIEALLALTADDKPPPLAVRCRKLAAVYYGFGDASGKAFGSTFQVDNEIVYRYGQWCSSMQEESSNYKELGNLVSALQEAVKDNLLADCEVFLFTDNSTAEGAYYKGNAPSRKLFELVLQLRKLAMSSGLILHVIHVSGKRMIAQGTDGLSRGDHTEGVMQGRSMTEFIPLHLSACFQPVPSAEGLVCPVLW
jgi:hypothetical protein